MNTGETMIKAVLLEGYFRYCWPRKKPLRQRDKVDNCLILQVGNLSFSTFYEIISIAFMHLIFGPHPTRGYQGLWSRLLAMTGLQLPRSPNKEINHVFVIQIALTWLLREKDCPILVIGRITEKVEEKGI